MKTDYTIRPIAYIYNDFPNKFGIPRQSGLINSLKSMIIFEPEYRFPKLCAVWKITHTSGLSGVFLKT